MRRTQTRKPGHVLLSELASLLAKSRANTACLLAYLGEFDARGLYVEGGYASMFDYCVHKLRLTTENADDLLAAASRPRP